MDIEVAHRNGGKEFNRFGEEIITCIVCRKHKTTMLGTKMCDNCYELDSRMRDNPMLVAKMMMGLSLEILKKDANKDYTTRYYEEPAWSKDE